ncbi:MAG TPA: class I SAM-dependent methyltransferase [Synechococcales cyanobacterium M55_K2018_004]|nr:class I SAM-dependent methyltransferase [Synechococcales cyanobacterium M55_K2018_004]
MAKGNSREPGAGGQGTGLANFLAAQPGDPWQPTLAAIAQRFNREYRGETVDLPDEVKALPIYQEKVAGILAPKAASPFWEMARPKKGERWLDIGCGVSFLIYPWRDWDAFFYGQEICSVAADGLNARGPQLNSKLFKGVKLGAAHQLGYENAVFDGAIATGFSCYYPLDYWKLVLAEVKRVLKPDGIFVFDVLNPESPLAENWAILETYLGSEAWLEPLTAWSALVKDAGGKVIKTQPGELFQLYKVKFS